MRGEIALLYHPSEHLLIGHGASLVSPSPTRLTRVATFPPDWDPDFVFPKPSSLKWSPTTSDSNLFYKVSRKSVLDASSTFHEKLSEFLAKLPSSPLQKAESDTVTVRRSKSELAGRLRKSVHFADDHGKALTQTIVAAEPSEVPPILKSAEVLKLLRKEFPQESATAQRKPSWTLDFEQPASDYAKFRDRLQNDKVVLENIFVQPALTSSTKENKCRLLGSIRVMNISFEKKVFVRVTENNWISYQDHEAFYSGSMESMNYDTFYFDIEVPIDDDFHPRLALCIGLAAGPTGGAENCWDNNCGKNYTIISKRARELWQKSADHDGIVDDSYQARVGSRTKPWVVPDCGPDPYAMTRSCWSDFLASGLSDACEPYW